MEHPVRALRDFFGLLAALTCTDLFAEQFFVCDCSTDAIASCVAGDDSADGTVLEPWRSYERARTAFGGISAGDTIALCRGGGWEVSGGSSRWVNGDCEASNRCTIGSYLPTWADETAPRPKIARLDGQTAFAFQDGGTAEHEEGYILSGLELQGVGFGNGVLLQNDIDDVLLDDLLIHDFRIGVHLAGSNDCGPDPECDGFNERIELRDSLILNNEAFGWLGSSNGSRIVNSTFDSNGSLEILDHNIYISGSSGAPTTGIEIIGNRLYRSTLDAMGVCRAVSLVVHGEHSNLLIEGNEVWEDVGMTARGCWGIAVDPGFMEAEAFTDVVIRGNTVRNVGNRAIGIASCVRCVIENNVVIQENVADTFSAVGIAAPDRDRGPNDAVMDDVVIRNNTVYFGPGSTGEAIRMHTEGDGHEVVSNVVFYAGDGGFSCFDADLPVASYAAFDHNHCFSQNAGSAQWTQGFGDLSNWQMTTGLDLASGQSDPLLADPDQGNFQPQSGASTLVDAGHPTLSSAVDFTGDFRDPAPDRGAFEWRDPLDDFLFTDSFETNPLP